MFLVGSQGALRAHQEQVLLELRAHQKHVLLELRAQQTAQFESKVVILAIFIRITVLFILLHSQFITIIQKKNISCHDTFKAELLGSTADHGRYITRTFSPGPAT